MMIEKDNKEGLWGAENVLLLFDWVMVNLFLQGFFFVKWIASSRFLPKDKLCFERNENKCNFGSEN